MNISDPRQAFTDEITSYGLMLNGPMEATGEIVRCDVMDDKRGSKNGWYVCFDHGDFAAGSYGSWKTGDTRKWYAGCEGITPVQRSALNANMQQAKADTAAKRKAAQDETASAVMVSLATAQDAGPDHGYLKKKLVKAFGLKQKDDALIMPIHNVDGRIRSAQFITEDEKRFYPGGEIAGNFFLLGDYTEPTYIAEGYATAATIHEATGKAVVVALNAGNLKPVVEAIRTKHDVRLIICADKDTHGKGLECARKAQEAADNVAVIEPPLEVGDFNDLHVAKGLDAVRKALNPPKPPNVRNLLEPFVVSREEADQIANAAWVYPNLIPLNHLLVLVAEANGGKTTIMRMIAADMADKGYEVFYINADISASGAKEQIYEAEEMGYTLLLPDMKVGMSMVDVVARLEQANNAGADFSNQVFIMDTLKKCTDMINKQAAKSFLKLQRSMTSKGATIINLGHTNKYPDSDGKPVYEGVGDVRSDHDDLVYLMPQKNADGSMVVSTLPCKTRADFQKITFEISPDREVKLRREYVDVLKDKQSAQQFEDDRDVINRIEEALTKRLIKQCDITEYCSGHGIGDKRTRAVLNRHAKVRWVKRKAMDNKTWEYFATDNTAPPASNQNDQNGLV